MDEKAAAVRFAAPTVVNNRAVSTGLKTKNVQTGVHPRALLPFRAAAGAGSGWGRCPALSVALGCTFGGGGGPGTGSG